jgi:CRISPR-associated endonuclease Cas1
MEAAHTLPHAHTIHKSFINKGGVLTLSGFGIKVRMQSGHLEIEDGAGAERRTLRLPRVHHGLRRLVVIGSDGFVSLAALRWLADQAAAFVMLERDGKVLAVTGPVRPSDARLRRAQALADSSGAALRIARELIRQKLGGQERVARFKLRDSDTAHKIARFAAELPSSENITTIRLIESQAASAYWSAWRTLPINFPKNDLARGVPDHWLNFGTRISPLTGSPRLAVNPSNAILNYLYAILESEAQLAAAALGLDPGLGVLHVDAPNRDSLALDLLEPIRPRVDAYLLDLIVGQPLRREWFYEERNGNARLMSSFAVRLSETAPVWGRAVAPIAEWVAQALWNSPRAANKTHLVPTRLTQRRRSEGRGNDFIVRATRPPKQGKVCGVCGAEGVQNRYCRSCAVDVSRENMARAAVIGHTKPRPAEVKARISNALSEHAIAISWWSPSSLPSWLSEECYVQKIQPRLKTIKVREIAQALQLSHPYAALIRAGRRRAHPRHWQALGRLVGISPEV